MIVRELVTRFGFNIDDGKLKKLEGSIIDIKKQLEGVRAKALTLGTAVLGISAGFTALSLSVAKSVDETSKLAKQIGVSTTNLQELELAAQNSGLKVGELTNSFSRFSDLVGRAKLSSKGTLDEFQNLGINLKDRDGKVKDINQLYSETAMKINAISDASKQAALSNKLFGTSSLELSKFIGQSNEELEKQKQEIRELGYIIGENGVKSSKEFIKSWNQLKIIVDSVKKELAVSFMPIFNELIAGFKEWFKANRILISQGLKVFVSNLTTVFKILFGVIKVLLIPIKFLIQLFGGLETASRLFTIAVGLLLIPKLVSLITTIRTLSLALLASPIGLITVAIGALALAIGVLIEDIWTWVEGNDSAIGRVLGDWKDFQTQFNLIWDNIVKNVTDSLIVIGNIGKSIFDGLIEAIMGPFNAALDLFEKVKSNSIFSGSTSNSKLPVNKDKNIKEFAFGGSSSSDLNLKAFKKKELDSNSNLPVNKDANIKQFALKGNGEIAQIEAPNMTPKLLNPNLNPISSPSSSNVNNNSVMNRNQITQNINENINITVPAGTTQDQSRFISDMIATEMRGQWNNNIIKGIDATTSR